MIRSYLYSAKHHNTNLGGRSATPPPTEFVKYDRKDAGICAIKAFAVHPAVLP